MGERLSDKREKTGMNRNTLRLWGIILCALGLLSRGILQTRVLGVGANSGQQLLEVLELSGGMAAAAVALVLEAMESCAVPIFAVLLVEGFEKTRSFRKYFLRMLGVALVSEIPYNFAIGGVLWDTSSRNPVFGMVLALVMLYLFRYYGGVTVKAVGIKVAVALAAGLWAVMFRVKFGISLLLIVAVLWAFRGRRTMRYLLAAAAAICCCVGNPLYMFSPFGFLLAHFYNGEEGFSVRRVQYALYPLLLILIGAAGFLLF